MAEVRFQRTDSKGGTNAQRSDSSRSEKPLGVGLGRKDPSAVLFRAKSKIQAASVFCAAGAQDGKDEEAPAHFVAVIKGHNGDFRCPICSVALVQGVLLHSDEPKKCKHVFCIACISKQWSNKWRSLECPTCSARVVEVVQADAVAGEVRWHIDLASPPPPPPLPP